jgi:hypothetical protein
MVLRAALPAISGVRAAPSRDDPQLNREAHIRLFINRL